MKILMRRVLPMVLIGIIIGSVTSMATDGNNFQMIAQETKVILASDNSQDTVALINEDSITKGEFEAYKNYLTYTSADLTDTEVLQKMITQRVLVQEAIAQGCSVSESEVTDYCDSIFMQAEQHPEIKRILEDYASTLDMTLSEYKEYCLPFYENMLLYNQWVEEKRKTFESENALSLQNEATQDELFDQYLNQAIESAIQSADIQILDAAVDA